MEKEGEVNYWCVLRGAAILCGFCSGLRRGPEYAGGGGVRIGGRGTRARPRVSRAYTPAARARVACTIANESLVSKRTASVS